MSEQFSEKPFNRLLLTGAAGGLGRVLRERIKPWANIVRLSDIVTVENIVAGEELQVCDLADKAAVHELLKGVDAVLHFGGISVEDKFEPIMQANILGMHHLYEAVYKLGVRRVVYASSSHTVGFYRTTELVDADSPLRPDGFYGLSKCFGEALSRYYYDRFGIETVCLRIGSSFPEPRNARMMVTYLSYDDLVELVRVALFTPRVGHSIIFGTSDNQARWWDNSKAAHLGFTPRDSSRVFADRFAQAAPAVDPHDLTSIYQGGPFVTAGPQY
ncbi:NAD(P)-dependent oxidoreductase [Undibacterium sp. TS12]|uniref:NAD-dependent epimerase/dehydratase family protein n=1 Tax=Undibacterium sp. TS12 TaxID=2908202 RepID=UPI001F4C93C9|nr:NAD(P)-dependent oxidoreductase [Undibacterium sp. TS12]MCH8621998.1 NAD(P)-dependent oxidoreductase [Undibacterium sp. TS12]